MGKLLCTPSSLWGSGCGESVVLVTSSRKQVCSHWKVSKLSLFVIGSSRTIVKKGESYALKDFVENTSLIPRPHAGLVVL